MLTLKDFNDQSKILSTKWNKYINNNDIGWNWIKVNNDTGYLSTKRFFSNSNILINNKNIYNSNNNNNNNKEILNNDEIIEENDNTTLKNSNNGNNQKTIIIEYDIIYSKSYQVPVLYLNGCYLNQKLTEPLSWEELWNLLPLSCFDKQQLSSTPYITQVEHPVLGTPCYQLHPCETNNLMEQILLLKNKIKRNNNDNNDNDNQNINNFNKGFSKDEYIIENNKEEIDNLESNINNNINNYLLSWLTIISPMVNIKIPLDLIKEYSN